MIARLPVSPSPCLLVFLWPILWWGFSQAAYCDDAPKPRIVLTVEQFEQLEKVATDMQAVHDQLDKTIVADGATIDALKSSTVMLNGQLAMARDSGQRAADEVAKMEGDYALEKAKVKRQAHAKWFWFVIALIEAVFIFRKPLARCFGVPLP